MNTLEIKAIAGVAAVQTLIKKLSTIDKHPDLIVCNIDGMLGTLTFNALNHISRSLFGVVPAIRHHAFTPSEGVLDLQRWYETLRCHAPTRRSLLLPKMDCDGYWGDETFKGFELLTNMHTGSIISEDIKAHSSGKRQLEKRNYVPAQQEAKPGLKTQYDLSRIEYVPLDKLYDNGKLDKSLAGSMGWQNPVISVDQYLAAGHRGFICIDPVTRDIFGVITFTPPFRGVGRFNYVVNGLYVDRGVRGMGIGTQLLSRVRRLANESETSVAINNPAQSAEHLRVIQFVEKQCRMTTK